VDTTLLKANLHAAIDRVVDEFVAQQASTAASPAAGAEDVVSLGPVQPFVFRWPADYGSEDFVPAHLYRVASTGGDTTVVAAWTTRYAWNAERRRAVVFHRVRANDPPTKWYPWTEFVQTDAGRYAATIPNPQRPRALLREGDPLPPRFTGKTVARADELFNSIREGASLRLVVDESDEEEMVRHGHWVAALRGRL
jgi:hypothetical protein